MKRKDDLLRLAFGELSAEVARAVEATATPAERSEVEAFRDLQRGLQHLPPPPPDNLSSERLRAAILDGELKTRRAAPSFSFAWMPFAVAAVAAVAFLARPKAPQAEPYVAINDESLRMDAPSVELPTLKPFVFSPSSPAHATRAAKASPAKPTVAVATTKPKALARRRPHRVHQEAPAAKTPVQEEALPVGPLVAMVGPPAPSSDVSKPEAEVVATPPSAVIAPTFDDLPPTRSENTVVIVSSGRDEDTGAPAAMEMEAGNVVVGG